MADKNQMTRGERLMAEIAQKHGGNVASSGQPQVEPQVAPQSAPTENPAGILSGIKGIYGAGRKEKIDKAAGYNRGGKISGKGTPTSDSIPATVRESGENILVSNKERILSEAQDKLVEGVAKNILGFESLDSMLEAGTGIPVGPTVKDGKRAGNKGFGPFSPFGPTDDYTEAMRATREVITPPTFVTNIPSAQGGIYGDVGLPPVSVGAGQELTIYENGGLDPTTVNRGIETMRAQLNSPSATPAMQSAPAPSAMAAPSSLPTTQTAQDQPPKSALAIQEAASKIAGGSASSASGPTVINSTGEAYTPEKGYNPLTSVVNLFKDSAQAARSGVNYDDVKAARISAEKSVPESNKTISDVVSPVGQQSYRPGSAMGNILVGSDIYGQSRSGDQPAPVPTPDKTGRDENGIITANSAAAYLGSDMRDNKVGQNGQKTTIFGTYDGKGVNEIMARENQARGEMIDNMVKAQGGNMGGILGDMGNGKTRYEMENEAWSNRLRQNDLLELARRGNQGAVAALMKSDADQNIASMSDFTSRQNAGLLAQAATRRDQLTMRGQDISGVNDAERNKILAKQAEAKQFHQPIAVPGGEVADPSDPMGQRKLKLPSAIYDPNTGKWMAQPHGGQNAATAIDVKPGVSVNAPDGTHTFQGKTIVVKNGKVTEVKNG